MTASTSRRRPRWSAAVVIGVMLVLAGAGGWMAAWGLPDRSLRVVPGNAPVNPGATDDVNLDANNSPVLTANPRDPANLVVANRVDLPRFSCALTASFDGGASWASSRLPHLDGDRLCFAPDVTFGVDGRLFLSFATMNPHVVRGAATEALWVTSSTDGGRTFSPPVQVAGPLTFQPRLVADTVEPGRLYLAWVQASEATDWGMVDDDNALVVSRSDDGGLTWSSPARVNPSSRRLAVAPTMAASDGGDLYLAYLDLGDDRLDYIGAHEGREGPPHPGPWSLVVASSADGGITWRESVADAGLTPSSRVLMAFPPRPALAVHDARLYVAFDDARLDDADVWLWTSSDGGERWGPPLRVNDTPLRDKTAQYLPAVAVAPDGRLDVVYYDRRADAADVMNEVSLQSSTDGGRTFTRRLRLSDRAFDSRIGYNSNRGLAQMGDRLALQATEGGDTAVWADTRGGIPLTGKQDLARAVVGFGQLSTLRMPLRLGGAAVFALGLVAVAVGARPRRTP